MPKVNCGIQCIKRYLKMTDNMNPNIIVELNGEVNENGLSFLSLIRTMEKYGYEVKAYKDEKVFYGAPYLMFDARRKHYYLVEQFDDVFCYMFDPNIGKVKLLRRLFELFWCQYYLTICYNKAE